MDCQFYATLTSDNPIPVRLCPCPDCKFATAVSDLREQAEAAGEL